MADSSEFEVEARLKKLLDRAGSEPDKAQFNEVLREVSHLLEARAQQAIRQENIPRHSADTDTFDIFSGVADRDAMWIEAVDGIEEATARMRQIAADSPGDYFVFDVSSRSILARANTAEPTQDDAKSSSYRKKAG